MSFLKNKKVQGLLLLSIITIIAVRCTSSSEAEADINSMPAITEPAVSIERGQHLVTAGACHDCHSPKIMTPFGPKVDSSRILSGHPADSPMPVIDTNALKPGYWIHFSPDLTAFVGPWGMSYSANLTADSATGIGAWNESNFVGAIRKGKHMGFDKGRPISPPMPWDNYNNLSDDDLKSIFAYLKSTAPVSNRVHQPFTPDEVRAMAKAKRNIQ
jgi:mono/diheme cytochrome c family protein